MEANLGEQIESQTTNLSFIGCSGNYGFRRLRDLNDDPGELEASFERKKSINSRM